MPAVQLKTHADAKSQFDIETIKSKGHAKLKTKDRNTTRKGDPVLERLNQIKRKKNIVPELDLKSLSPRAHKKSHTSSKDENGRRVKQISPRTTAAKLARKRQWEIGNAHSKLNIPDHCHQHVIKAAISPRKTFRDEIKTSRSLYYLTPRNEGDHNNSLVDVENISPNQLLENYFECTELDDFLKTQFPDFEESSEYDYGTPQTFEDVDYSSMVSVRSSKLNSPGVLRHFKELLKQEERSKTNLLRQSEITLLKDIVKADERHQKLQKDDYDLLKEILMGHLKEITQQERVIKIALKKIRSRSDDDIEVTTLRDRAEQPMEDTARKLSKASKNSSARSCSARSSHNTSSSLAKNRKQEVDVIFKNVPSLEKEIRILRSLGLKLEETLKKSERKPSARGKPHYVFHNAETKHFCHPVSIATMTIYPKARQVVTGIVQEFQIRHQTIDELKLEKEFFIPTDLENFVLQRTDFRKLSRNPELLLRRLKPFTKNSKMKFNFIEQDPMFFNHFLAKMCKICSDPIEGPDTYIPKKSHVIKQSSGQKLICVTSGAGDHSDFFCKASTSSRLELPALKDKTPSSNSLNKKKKKKINLTPMSESGGPVTAKNNLLRKLFLGTIQLSIFLTVVTAILYPDLICL